MSDILKIALVTLIAGALGGFVAGLVGGNQPEQGLVGGITNYDIVGGDWIAVGDRVSSTTAQVYEFSATYQVTGAEGEDGFTNTQIDENGNRLDLVITDITVHTASNASTTFRLFQTATSTNSLGIAAGATEEPVDCAIVKNLFATTTGAGWTLHATSTTPGTCGATGLYGGSFVLRYGKSTRTQIVPGSSLENDVDTCRGDSGGTHCEAATSTASGLKPITVFIRGYATSTPRTTDTDIR